MSRNQENDFYIYNTLSKSIVSGFARVYATRLASNTFRIAVLKHLMAKEEGVTSEFAVDSGIDDISSQDYDAFCYVSNISLLVYATTLVDTFLNESTKFLIMRHPGVLTNEAAVQFKDILAAQSKAALLTDIISNKVKDVSFRSFLDRIKYLRTRFGLEIELEDDTVEALTHFSNLRNVVVHDQSIFELELSDEMSLILKRKTCPLHPTPVRDEDLFKAWLAYRDVLKQIYLSVVSQVLKCEGHPEVKKMRVLLEKQL
jgi:hypothetical protein